MFGVNSMLKPGKILSCLGQEEEEKKEGMVRASVVVDIMAFVTSLSIALRFWITPGSFEFL